jgi:hypothetical protein
MKVRLRHGDARRGNVSAEYSRYTAARNRCNNPKNPQYEYYGGRGIEFRFESFEQFLAEVGRRPSPNYSIDRINNDGHYEPGNVRWASRSEQAYNRRKARIPRRRRLLTYNGETASLLEWSERVGINAGTISSRIDRHGYSVEEALTRGIRK